MLGLVYTDGAWGIVVLNCKVDPCGLPMPSALFMVNCTHTYLLYVCVSVVCVCVAVWSCWSTQYTVTACCLGLIFIDKL